MYELDWNGREFNIIILWMLKIITTIDRNKQLSRYDSLPAVPQVLPAVMFSQLVTECSRPSAESHIDSYIPAAPHVERKPEVFYIV